MSTITLPNITDFRSTISTGTLRNATYLQHQLLSMTDPGTDSPQQVSITTGTAQTTHSRH